jgi:hypothetical protein
LEDQNNLGDAKFLTLYISTFFHVHDPKAHTLFKIAVAVMANQAGIEMSSVQDVFLEENPGPTIAEHALECNRLFKKYKDIVNKYDQDSLDDQLARFTSWTLEAEVFGPPNVSLDYKLRYSPTVVDSVHELLDVICGSLTARK